jgi:hypothetical protein
VIGPATTKIMEIIEDERYEAAEERSEQDFWARLA